MSQSASSPQSAPRRPLLGQRVATLVVSAVLLTGAALIVAASPSGAATKGNVAWLCQPGTPSDPCAFSLSASAVSSNGAVSSAQWPRSPLASKVDCFYVHPTVSADPAKNTGLAVTKAELGVAVVQAAPFSNVCRVWAPQYRSQTESTVAKGLAGDTRLLQSTFNTAYESVLTDWKAFVSQSDGRPIVLIGDSQGSAILIHLVASVIEREPSILTRLVSVILVGGNLQVPTGKTVGATFTKVPLCTSANQTGCAIAFSSFPSEPPVDSFFGRPGQGVSLQSGQSTKSGEQVACVNPADLSGGTKVLDPFFFTLTQAALTSSVSTPWVTYPNLYSAHCARGGGATWLQVTSLRSGSDARPVVTEGAPATSSGPQWGYHVDEFSLALGNLVHDVAVEEATWSAHH